MGEIDDKLTEVLQILNDIQRKMNRAFAANAGLVIMTIGFTLLLVGVTEGLDISDVWVSYALVGIGAILFGYYLFLRNTPES